MSHIKVRKETIYLLKKVNIRKSGSKFIVTLPGKKIKVPSYTLADRIADKATRNILYKEARKA